MRLPGRPRVPRHVREHWDELAVARRRSQLTFWIRTWLVVLLGFSIIMAAINVAILHDTTTAIAFTLALTVITMAGSRPSRFQR